MEGVLHAGFDGPPAGAVRARARAAGLCSRVVAACALSGGRRKVWWTRFSPVRTRLISWSCVIDEGFPSYWAEASLIATARPGPR